MRMMILLLAAAAMIPSSVSARQDGPHRKELRILEAQPIASPGGRAPWNRPWEYDSGSGNDRRPELPYYQQGRGQQTGGPARNLLPDDGLQLFPR